MASSFVEADSGQRTVVQGFRPDAENGYPGVVYLATIDQSGTHVGAVELTPENAHILSEEIRKHAEFAQTVREQGE